MRRSLIVCQEDAMPPQPVYTPIPEVADRYTIALLKLQRLDKTQIDPESMQQQVEYYKVGLDLNDPVLSELVEQLYEINGMIWDVEAEIRNGQENEMELAEIGRRAIVIRNLNRKRLSIKNKIVGRTGEGFIDCKMNYSE